MSATVHQLNKSRLGRGKANKPEYRVGAQNLLWQGFLNFRSYVFEEVDPSETKLKVDHPDLFAKLSVLEEQLIFELEPRSDLAVMTDIRDWMTVMVEIVAQKEKQGVA